MDGATVTNEPYATAHQLARLEAIVQKQQTHIDLLEQERALFQRGIEDYLTNQQDAAAKERGSKGQDVIVVTKYVSTCIQRAIQQLQTEVARQIQDSLPMKQVQTLERRLLSRPYSNEEVGELAHRISQLETQFASAPQQLQSQSFQQPSNNDHVQEQIETLQQHIHHLETNMIKEVQRAYQTNHKPGDYAGPLGKLQVDVDTLKREMQMMKALDGQTLAETIMKTALANVRTELQTEIDKKASKDDLEAFREQVARTEAFLRKLQTMWSSVYREYETFRSEIQQQFSEERWTALVNQVIGDTDKAIANTTQQTNALVAKQTVALDDMLTWNRTTLTKVYDSVKKHTSQDMLERHYSSIQKALLSRFEPAIEIIRQHLNQRVASLETAQRAQRQQQLAFISEVKTQLSASELDAMMKQFEDRLAEQTRIYTSNQTQVDQFQTKTKQMMTLLKQIQEDTEAQVKTVEANLAELRGTFQIHQADARATLDTWCNQRKTQFDTRVIQLEERLQDFQDKVRVAEQSLQLTVDSRKQFENTQQETFKQLQQTIQKQFTIQEKATDERITGRLAELSGPMRIMMKELTEQMASVHSFLSDESITEFVHEIETRIKKGQEDWQRVRSSELHEAISFFGTKLVTMDKTLQTELMQQREIVQMLQARIGDRYRRELTELRDKYAQIRPLIQKQILESLKQYKNVSNTPLPPLPTLPTWFDTAPKCFFTAMIGAPGQSIKPLPHVTRIPGWDYICFTNKPIHDSRGWTIVRVEMPTGSAALDVKRYKWRSIDHLPEYEVVVWVDGTITPNANTSPLIERWVTNMKETGHGMSFRPHEQRVCVWDECEAVIEAKQDSPLHVEKVRTKLKQIHMPKNWGLFDTNCMILFHRDATCRKVTEAVWNQLQTTSICDQLALPLVLVEQNIASFKTETLMRAFTKT